MDIRLPNRIVLVGCIGAAFQHLKGQGCSLTGLRCSGSVAYLIGGELTHLVHLTVVRVFVRYRQHFVLVQSTLERYITQSTVKRIFAGGQQPCRLDLLIVYTAGQGVSVEVPYITECYTRLVDLTEVRCVGLDIGIEVIGIVIRCGFPCAAPVKNRVIIGFT